MQVRDVMHPGGAMVSPDTPLAQVAGKAREGDVVVIGEYDRLVGEVTEREIVACGTLDADKAARLTVGDVMAKPIIYCYPEEEVDAAVRIMRKHAVRRLPVVSHQKRLIGIISLDEAQRRTRH
jgi:CBS domain-containing protein